MIHFLLGITPHYVLLLSNVLFSARYIVPFTILEYLEDGKLESTVASIKFSLDWGKIL
jgi:hypothetical protein